MTDTPSGPTGPDHSPYLTLPQAADYLGVGRSTLERWVAEGRLTRRRVLGSRIVRYHRSDLDALMQPEQPSEL